MGGGPRKVPRQRVTVVAAVAVAVAAAAAAGAGAVAVAVAVAVVVVVRRPGSVVGYWLLGVGCWLLVVRLVVGCWLLLVACCRFCFHNLYALTRSPLLSAGVGGYSLQPSRSQTCKSYNMPQRSLRR